MKPVKSNEYKRIVNLPRRDVRNLPHEDLQRALQISGKYKLFPIQIQMIVEAFENKGLLACIGVGHGKTLPSILIPTVIECQRPLLMVPAKLRDQTHRIIEEMKRHFKVHDSLSVISYAAISNDSGILNRFAPDLILADECHMLKDTKSGRTKRFLRYLSLCPNTIFCGFSGTIINKGLFDFAHLAVAALRESAPVPYKSYSDLRAWDMALRGECNIGILKNMPFKERLIQTPGIVVTSAASCNASIIITLLKPFHDETIKKALKDLDDFWTLPDGTELCEILEYTAARGQLYCGFYYRWTERAPHIWLKTRSIFNRWLRNKLRYNKRGYDTPGQIYEACEKKEYTSTEYEDWIEIKNSFIPKTEAIWLSDSHVIGCRELARKNNAIVWTQYKTFGKKIKLKYYDSDRVYDHEQGTPCCLSIKACGEGKNLQKWSQNVVAFPPVNGVQWEQLIGRTHRTGQEADCVEFTTFGNVDKALKRAELIEEKITGMKQKLLMARIIHK